MKKRLLELSLKGDAKGKLSIISFHRVEAHIDPFSESITAPQFDRQFEFIEKYFNVFPMDKAFNNLIEGTLPPRSLVITFDDGYANNYHYAFPVLKKRNIPATFFICSGSIDGGIMWNDSIIEAVKGISGDSITLDEKDGFPEEISGKYDVGSIEKKVELADNLRNHFKYLDLKGRENLIEVFCDIAKAKLPNNLMMTSEQINEIYQSGMIIGGHTLSHPILKVISDEDASHQIKKDKENLEQIIGDEIDFFAYPNGKPTTDYGDRDISLLKETGYKAALTTSSGVSTIDTDPFQLPRFTPWDRTENKYLFRMFLNGFAKAEVI